jgi:hypothetical protein
MIVSFLRSSPYIALGSPSVYKLLYFLLDPQSEYQLDLALFCPTRTHSNSKDISNTCVKRVLTLFLSCPLILSSSVPHLRNSGTPSCIDLTVRQDENQCGRDRFLDLFKGVLFMRAPHELDIFLGKIKESVGVI